MFFVVSELGVAPLLRCGRVWLQMSMDSRLGMISVGLVEMLRRNNRREAYVGRQDQADDNRPKEDITP